MKFKKDDQSMDASLLLKSNHRKRFGYKVWDKEKTCDHPEPAPPGDIYIYSHQIHTILMRPRSAG